MGNGRQRAGLIWLKNANVPADTRTWTQALSDVAQLNIDAFVKALSFAYWTGDDG